MPFAAWLALDAALVVIALVVLAGLSLTLWRQISALSRDLRRTGERLAGATALHAGPVEVAQRRR